MLSNDEIERNWSILREKCPSELRDLLIKYEQDVFISNGVLALGIKHAPAGKGVHHAYKGGLVEHVLEVLSYIDLLAATLHTPQDLGELDIEAMHNAAVLHDIHKGYLHFVEKTAESGESSIDYYSGAWSTFLTPNQKTYAMLMSTVCYVSPKVQHIIHSSEGGWAENPPKETTVEAKLVYLADELSVCNSRLKQGNSKSIRARDAAWFTHNDF